MRIVRALTSLHGSSAVKLVFCVAALMSGCTMVGPDYSQPPVQTGEQWLEVDNARVKQESIEDKEWWKLFDDPVLNALIAAAYEQNLPLQIAGVRVLEARARLAIAVGDFYPQAQQAFGDYTYNRLSKNEAVRGIAIDSRNAQLGLGASWELDFWGKFRRAIQAEDANLLASMAAYDDALVTLLGDVANTYVVIRILEDQIRIARANATVQRETLNIADARFKGGQTAERDVQQAITQLRATQATIPQLELSLEQAKNALSILLGMTPVQVRTKLSSASSGIPLAPAGVAVGIPADLLRRRPDVRVAEMQAMSESARIGATKAELYPAFSLGGTFGLAASDARADVADIFSMSSRMAVVGPSFEWNLLNYGQITNAVRLQDAVFQGAVLNYQNTVLLAQREVEDGLIAFVKSQEAVVFLAQAADAARQTVQLARVQYEGGATDYTTVINAQAALLDQENLLAQARGAVPQGLISVYRALGGGWQIRGDNEFVPEAVLNDMRGRTDWGRLLAPQGQQQQPMDTNMENPVTKPVW